MRQEMLGGLRTTIAGGVDREGGGNGPAVVLLHGFGAPGTDLVSLYRQLSVPREVRFVFPEAPLDLAEELGPGAVPPGARAWWMIDVEALQRSMMTGERRDRSRERPAGLDAARARVLALLEEMEHRLDVPSDRIVLGGFSQGAMLGLDVALRTDRPLSGLVLMSGTLIAADEWSPLMPQRRGLKVLQSHGRADQLLPWASAERLSGLLRDAGLDVRFLPFNGGHAIPDSVVDALGRFIAECTEA